MVNEFLMNTKRMTDISTTEQDCVTIENDYMNVK